MRTPQRLAALLILLGIATASHADDARGNFVTGPWASGTGVGGERGLLLAAAGTAKPDVIAGQKGGDDDLPWYSKNRMHKYLGFGSMGLALATLAAPKEKGGAHENLAKGAAFLGGAAVANGVYAHWDDMEFSWDDPDTRHAIFGALGTLGYLLAVSKDGEGGHAALGGLGAVSMAYAIKVSW